ncbi:hypothetical protein B0T20DRAFT_172524 [Sordaria brevicollis]|uniref:Uncharacterized protein n=1 Tax=Sordaria brevicollis TaxID=83679 RepID=A0AAE0PHJ7_SORBR|nr:hypothetical protein B0T20DRAFT_172524 [Sordaria brevicollis]
MCITQISGAKQLAQRDRSLMKLQAFRRHNLADLSQPLPVGMKVWYGMVSNAEGQRAKCQLGCWWWSLNSHLDIFFLSSSSSIHFHRPSRRQTPSRRKRVERAATSPTRREIAKFSGARPLFVIFVLGNGVTTPYHDNLSDNRLGHPPPQRGRPSASPLSQGPLLHDKEPFGTDVIETLFNSQLASTTTQLQSWSSISSWFPVQHTQHTRQHGLCRFCLGCRT